MFHVGETKDGKTQYTTIVDDECIRDFLDIALSDKAHITTACDGLEALDKIQQHQFDLIISDIQMPHLNVS